MNFLLILHQVITDFEFLFLLNLLVLSFHISFPLHLRLLNLNSFAHSNITFLDQCLWAQSQVNLDTLRGLPSQVVNNVLLVHL